MLREEHPSLENVLRDRVFIEGEDCYSDVCERVANFIFPDNDVDKVTLINMMMDRKIVPASPYLMQAGTSHPQLCSCFALPVTDDLGDIFEYLKKASKVFQRSGGVGTNWSKLRAEGTSISSGGKSTGPISFMGVFDSMVEAVRHGGKKKGAALAVLDTDHPDIEKFITMKNTEGAYKNFNISVMVKDDFMENVTRGSEQEVKLFNLICQSIWNRAEPGLLFYDTINENNPVSPWKSISEANPCAEEPLVPYGSCNLIGINWSEFVDSFGKFDFKSFEPAIRLAIRLGDKAIDLTEYPLEEIEETSKYIRQIGIYPLGLHDMLIKMNLAYDSIEGRDQVLKVLKFVDTVGWSESVKLGKKYGPAPIVNDMLSDNDIVPHDARNTAITTAAPGGTTSIIAYCSNGIEPVFSYVMDRVGGHGAGVTIVNPLFRDAVEKLSVSNVIKDNIINEMHTKGSIQHIPSIDDFDNNFKSVFKTALDISPLDHIRMQSIVQKYTTSGVSKTINCSEETTPEEIGRVIVSAWRLGCKGITFYRQNSRDAVVYGLKKDNATEASKSPTVIELVNPVHYVLANANGRILPKTPRETPATMYKRNTGCGKMMIAVGEVDGRPHSITIVNKGGCDAMTQAVTELTSLCERFGVPQWNINKVLMNIKCSAALRNVNSDGKSCPDIIGKVLNEFYPHEEEPPKEINTATPTVSKKVSKGVPCPECYNPETGTGGILEFSSGCRSCPSCGWSKCN